MTSARTVWLITGTSSGFGKDIAVAALRHGDNVIATARKLESIDSALTKQGANTLQLDVTDSIGNLKAIAAKAIAIHGRIDVLVNNAGYLHVGVLEDTTPEETLQQFNTNVFGALNVTRAFLPVMRKQASGIIVNIGSIGGWDPITSSGLYTASKFALRGLSESLSLEVAPLGIRVHCIEPGYFRTAVLEPGKRTVYNPRIADYEPRMKQIEKGVEFYSGKQPGDPEKFAQLIVDLMHGEGVAKGREVPVSLPVGRDAWQIVGGAVDKERQILDDWKDVIESTDFA